MKKLRSILTAAVFAASAAFAPSALADAAVDPIDIITHDESWVVYLVIAVGSAAFAVLSFTIIKIRRSRE